MGAVECSDGYLAADDLSKLLSYLSRISRITVTNERDENESQLDETAEYHTDFEPESGGSDSDQQVNPYLETEDQVLTVGESSATNELLSPGNRVGDGGRYRLLRQIGRGGFGAVFEGHDSQLDRKVAVKVPRSNVSTKRLDEFVHEARRMAKLQHPNIAAVYDVGRTDQYVFIVTEFLDGRSLESLVRNREVTCSQAVQWTIQIADALAHAHSQGMIHRDIKPGNIIITRDGKPVLFDFGLAITDIDSAGPDHQIVGTPAYMSPEQAQGRAHRVDGRTDIFSLGAVLYTMLTHRPPFRAKTLRELRRRIIEDDPQPPRQLIPGLPAALEEACLKAMEKQISDRFTTAGDFAGALRQVGGQLPTGIDDWVKQVDDSEPSPVEVQPSSSRRRIEALRRRVTLAVANFEPALVQGESVSLDPEQQLEYSQQFKSICRECGRSFEGTVVSTGGQEVLMCFGFPVAQEDAAQRAVRYGLDLLRQIYGDENAGKGRRIEGIEAWVTVHSGEAVVEDSGDEAPDAVSLAGETVNIATRLEGVAEPGKLTISNATRELVEEYFDMQPIGQQRLRGVADSILTYAVSGAKASSNRVELLDPGNLTPLVGRDTELSILKDRWEHADEGLGQVVLLIGDAGLGKSRLVRELKEHVADLQSDLLPPIVEFRCSAYHQHTGFFPAVEYFDRLFQFDQCAAAQDRLEHIAGHLDQVGLGTNENVALLAGLLNVPLDNRYPPLALSPPRQRELTQALLLAWLRAVSKDQTTLFVVEDLHWADPSTLEWLSNLVVNYDQDRVLTLLSFRPEFQTPWASLAHQTQIALNRLTKRQIREMMVRRTKIEEIPDSIVAQVIERTDGVPLFVEEFTKIAQESGALSQPNGAKDDSSNVFHQIPASLQDLLIARLDRMASNQEVVQLAATMGREFAYRVLAAVADMTEEQLQRELAKLVEAEVLFQKGRPPECTYIFKHALIQDAAYGSLLTKTRHRFHKRIAEVLESELEDVANSQPELLAHHFTEAGETERAVRYWLKAGLQAQASSAVIEAIDHFTTGLKQLELLPASVERDQLELEFQLPLGNVLIQAKGYAASEVAAAFQRAHALCRQIGEGAPLFHVSVGMWKFTLVNGDFGRCANWADDLLRLAEAQTDPGIEMEACFPTCCTLFYVGHFAKSVEYGEKGFALYEEERCKFHSQFTGQNAGLGIPAYGALAMWAWGYPDRALQWSREGVALGKGINDPFSLAFGLYHLGWLAYYCGNWKEVKECGDRGREIARELSFVFFEALATINQGAALLCKDDATASELDKGIELVREGLAAYMGTGAKLHITHPYTMLAEGLMRAGNFDEAQTELDRAQEHAERSGELFALAEMHRLQGALHLARAPENLQDAQPCFRKALGIAVDQQSKSWKLRTATSLARLPHEENQRQDAQELLAQAYNAFDEGFTTRDLQTAKTLLDDLR